MAANQPGKTRPEQLLRSRLHRAGLRFRKNMHGLPGRPDVVFTRQQVAVFVDGDFWHGRCLKEEGQEALAASFGRSKRAEWTKKITETVDRDRRVTETLKADGWTVLRFWASSVVSDPGAVKAEVEKAVLSATTDLGMPEHTGGSA